MESTKQIVSYLKKIAKDKSNPKKAKQAKIAYETILTAEKIINAIQSSPPHH